jgi:hypothetical protein
VTSADFPAADSADTAGAAGTDCAGGTDHDSTVKVVPGTFAENPTAGWCVDEYYFQRPVPASSSF